MRGTQRKILGATSLVLCFSCGFGSGPSTASAPSHPGKETAESQDTVLHSLEAVRCQSHSLSCKSLVSAVNGLRHLGKAGSLDTLDRYYAVKDDVDHPHNIREMNVICICRILFQRPKDGWKEPWEDVRGVHPNVMIDSGNYAQAAKANFPLYPVVISDGVPFVLNAGYIRPNGPMIVGGIPDEGKRHLELCRNLELIAEDLKTTGYDQAANDLVQSVEFKNLLANSTETRRSEVKRWIIEQAARDTPVNAVTMPATIPSSSIGQGGVKRGRSGSVSTRS